ncbi:MAG: FHA domain-containing protein, partial [Thermocrispum sp.]
YNPPGYDQGYAPPAVQGGNRQLAATLQLDDGSNRSYSLKQGGNVVGRGQDADFRLPDTGVSRRHLEITWDGQSATLADIGSTNGTTVNGTPVQTWQLADGDVIRVGHSSLTFRTQG